MTKRITTKNSGNSEGKLFPGDFVYIVKRYPLNDNSKYFQFDVIADRVINLCPTKKDEERIKRGEIFDPDALLIELANETEEVKVKLNPVGTRELDEVIVSEQQAIETVNHFYKEEMKKIMNDIRDADEAKKQMENRAILFEDKDSLDFDKPGGFIEMSTKGSTKKRTHFELEPIESVSPDEDKE